MERPFDAIVNMSYKSLVKAKDNFIFNFNQTDKILVWIVGFAITAISIIVSNLTNLSDNYCPSTIKIVLVLLMISIISGIVYRISALLFMTKYQNILFFLEGAFSEQRMMPTETKELKNPEDIHEIYQKIKNDFDEDYIDVLELFNKTESKDSKKYYVDYLKEEYSRLAKWSANEVSIATEYIKGIYQKAFGLSDNKIAKIFLST